jgi:ribosomal protein S18 acetylase RimI-like enzyme
MSDIDIRIGNNLPLEQLLALYNSVNWLLYTNEVNRDKLVTAVRNSTYVVSAWQEDQLIGLARGLSDDVSIFFLQDILIRPEYQNRGIGRTLLANCQERFKHVRAKVLMTDNEKKQLKFYKSMGFENTKEITRFTLNVFVKMGINN